MSYTVDKCTGGTATAQNNHVDYPPAQAFDNSTGFYSWWTSQAKPAWIKYDFGSGVAWPITRVRIYPTDFGGSYCKTVSIEGSNNDSSWTALKASTAVTAGQWNTLDFTNTTEYRYIRVNGLTSDFATISITEIEMMYDNTFEGHTSKGDYATLPTTDAVLETNYTSTERINIQTKDGTRVNQTAISQYMIHQLKDIITGYSKTFFTWVGQSDLRCTYSTIYLQVYNRATPAWETLDSDSLTAENTDITLTGYLSSITNYVDGDDLICCRIYQLGI